MKYLIIVLTLPFYIMGILALSMYDALENLQDYLSS